MKHVSVFEVHNRVTSKMLRPLVSIERAQMYVGLVEHTEPLLSSRDE